MLSILGTRSGTSRHRDSISIKYAPVRKSHFIGLSVVQYFDDRLEAMTTNVLRYAFAVSAMNTCLLLAFLPTAALAQEPEMAAESTPGPMRAVSRSQGPVRLPEQDVQAFLASPANLLSTTIDKDTLMTQVRALAVSDPDALARLIELVKSASDPQAAAIGAGLARAATVLAFSMLEADRTQAQAIQKAAAGVQNAAFQAAYESAVGDPETGALGAAGAASAGNIAAGATSSGVFGNGSIGPERAAAVQGTTLFDGASDGFTATSGGGGSSDVSVSVNSVSSL